MDALEAFEIYLKNTFEEEYDPCNFDHMNKLAFFEAGWDAMRDLVIGKQTWIIDDKDPIFWMPKPYRFEDKE